MYTQVYNAKPYIEQCISSVLTQTYSAFEYILVDNGSTDGGSEILREFTEKDERIKFISYKENHPLGLWHGIIYKHTQGKYVTYLDSDDWLEPDYLEKLVSFAENNNLDIACTGTNMHFVATGQETERKVENPLILSKKQFAVNLPYYHVFFRTTWNKFIKSEVIRRLKPDIMPQFLYGSDTWYCFQLLRHAKRIGIDNSVLHHYRIHNKSVSYNYDPARFDSDVYLYNDAIDFLHDYGPVSERNQDFLNQVYANAVSDTVRVVNGAKISPADKLRECRRIVEHPVTQAAYQQTGDSVKNSRTAVLQCALNAGIALGGEDNADLPIVLKALRPGCGAAATADMLQLFQREYTLMEALINDDRDALICGLLDLIVQKKYNKQFDLGAALNSLLQDTLLRDVKDARFFRTHAESCRLLIFESNTAALEQMTGVLLDSKRVYAEEEFLSVYLSLAALENQVPAFLFGNIRLATLYLNEGRKEDCRAVLDDLTEMGSGEHEEVIALRESL